MFRQPFFLPLIFLFGYCFLSKSSASKKCVKSISISMVHHPSLKRIDYSLCRDATTIRVAKHWCGRCRQHGILYQFAGDAAMSPDVEGLFNGLSYSCGGARSKGVISKVQWKNTIWNRYQNRHMVSESIVFVPLCLHLHCER